MNKMYFLNNMNHRILAFMLAALVTVGLGSAMQVLADTESGEIELGAVVSSDGQEEDAQEELSQEAGQIGEGESAGQTDESSADQTESQSTSNPLEITSSQETSSDPALELEVAVTTTVQISPGPTLHIPDENFRIALIDKLGLNDDLHQNNELFESDLQQIQALQSLSMTDSSYGILDITGIQYFTGLTSLKIRNQQLQKVDLSGMNQLRTVDLYNNQIEQINLSGCDQIVDLSIWYNQISDIDLSDLTNLKKLDICSNRLESIDLTQYMNMTHICIGNNHLKSLELSGINLGSASLSSQTLQANAAAVHTNNKWIVDMKEIVGREHIGRISFKNIDGDYDLATGILTLNVLPNSITYQYQCDIQSSQLLMNVQVPLVIQEVAKYKITFRVNGSGTIDDVDKVEYELEDGAPFPIIPTPVAGGSYRFSGWYDADGKLVRVFPDVVTSDLDYTAKFTVISSGGGNSDSGGGSSDTSSKVPNKPSQPEEPVTKEPEVEIPEMEIVPEIPIPPMTIDTPPDAPGGNQGESGVKGTSDEPETATPVPEEADSPVMKILIDYENRGVITDTNTGNVINSIISDCLQQDEASPQSAESGDYLISVSTLGAFEPESAANRIISQGVRGALFLVSLLGLLNLIHKKFKITD